MRELRAESAARRLDDLAEKTTTDSGVYLSGPLLLWEAVALAQGQPGYLGMESAREEVGITVSYWADLDSIRAWKANAEHLQAQALGHQQWYSAFTTRIARVEREYSL